MAAGASAYANVAFLGLPGPWPETIAAQERPTCQGKPATIVGTDLGERLAGTAGEDVIVGGAGNDVISGRAQNDIICAGSGDDVVAGGEGPDFLIGADGNDRLDGEGEFDALDGGPGDDQLEGGSGSEARSRVLREDGIRYEGGIRGGPGRDVLSGGDGTDYLMGEDGPDRLDGGAEWDALEGGPDADTLDGGPGNDRSMRARTENGMERLYGIRGGAGNDTLIGGDGHDHLLGESGHDTLRGGDNIDTLTGGDGNDVLEGGPGDNDLLDGDRGDDRLDGGPGPEYIFRAILDDSGRRIWGGIRGGPGNDILDGGDGGDYLFGDAGNDTIDGGKDRDTIEGGPGRDELSGGPGDETTKRMVIDYSGARDIGGIRGGPGNDTLSGGRGKDELFGDGDRDKCFGGPGTDYCHGGKPGPEKPSPSDPDICDRTVEKKRSCWTTSFPKSWTGTASGSLQGAGWQETFSATYTVTLQSEDDGSGFALYQGSATIQWSASGSGNDCSWSGSGTTTNGGASLMLTDLKEMQETNELVITGDSVAPSGLVTVNCSYRDPYQASHVPLGCGVRSGPFAYLATDRTLAGSRSYTATCHDTAYEVNWQWSVNAQ